MNNSSLLEDQYNPQLKNQIAQALDTSANASHNASLMGLGGASHM